MPAMYGYMIATLLISAAALLIVGVSFPAAPRHSPPPVHWVPTNGSM